MQAITSAAQQISSGQANIVVAGGTESMSRSPLYLRSARFGGDRTKLVDSNTEAGQQPQEIYGENLGMGITAENVAMRYNISREEQDAFSVESQRRAAKAMEEGKFKDEIVPVQVLTGRVRLPLKRMNIHALIPQCEKLASLKPAFRENGTVTAGNACGRNDGATALVLMKASEAKRLQVKPIAKIVDWATAGVSPEVMGIGPVPAVGKLYGAHREKSRRNWPFRIK